MAYQWLRRFPWLLPLLVTAGVFLLGVIFDRIGGPFDAREVSLWAGAGTVVLLTVLLFQLRRFHRPKAKLGALCVAAGLIIITADRFAGVDVPLPALVFATVLACIGAVFGLLDYWAARKDGHLAS